MAADINVLVRRHSAFNTLKQPIYLFHPDSGELEKQSRSIGEPQGWVVDFERVVDGAKQIIFFRQGSKKFVALDAEIYEVGAGHATVSHKRGILLSQMMLLDHLGEKHVVKYVTPWWRLLFDDGSHPDLQFPLEYFSKKWTEGPQETGTIN